MKRIVSVVLASLLLVSLVAACTGNEAPLDLGASTQAPVSTVAPGVSDAPEATEEPAPVYDYAKIYWYFNESGNQYPPDAYMCQKALEEINVEFIPVNPPGTEYENILFAMLASGTQLDIINTHAALTPMLIADEIIIPVEQYLNEDYIPNLINISKFWDDSVLNAIRNSDGHIYFVPGINVANPANNAAIPMIRKDWLDNLGLPVPTTVEELSDTLIAFMQASPNGDNVNYFATMANELYGLSNFFSVFAASGSWYIGQDGTDLVEYGWCTPRIKEALEYIRNLIANKAMNEDLITTNMDTITERINAGVCGFIYGWGDLQSQEKMQVIYPQAEWTYIEPFKSPYYDKGYVSYGRTTNPTRGNSAITVNCKDVEAALRLMDWLCVDTATVKGVPGNMTFEGSYWYQFGERGLNWEGIDGVFIGPNQKWPDNPEYQALSDKFTTTFETMKWTYQNPRFPNAYDTRWMGNDQRTIDFITWRNALPNGNDVPADSQYLPRAMLVPLSVENEAKRAAFIAAVGEFSATGKFAEILAFPAILGKGDIDQLFEEWMAYMNSVGYQELRQIMTDHYNANPYPY